jgi:hypothetical protein
LLAPKQGRDTDEIHRYPQTAVDSFIVGRRLSEAVRGAGGNLTLVIGDERCAAQRRLLAKHLPRVEAGDYTVLPPFFPGDGCSLSWNIPRRRSAAVPTIHAPPAA